MLALDAVRRATGRGAARMLLRAGVPIVGALLLGFAAIVASQAAAPTHALADDTLSGAPVVPGQSDDRFDIGQWAQAEEQPGGQPPAAGAPAPSGQGGLLTNLGLLPPPAGATPPPSGLSLAPVVNTVAALTTPPPSGGTTLGGLLGLDGGAPGASSSPTVGGLLQGVSSLLLPQGQGTTAAPLEPPYAPQSAATAPSAQSRGDGAAAVHAETPSGAPAAGPATALNHGPMQPPLAPAPQPTAPQPPAGGSLGANQIPGLGMAVAAFLFATLLVSMASRRSPFTTPMWKSVRIVALIERPG